MSIDRYLRVSQVSDYVGLSRATIYAMEKAGTFPKKIALGARAIAWLESDIKQWMEERKSVVKTGREAKPGRLTVAKKRQPPKDTLTFGVEAPRETDNRKASGAEHTKAFENGRDMAQNNPPVSEKQTAVEVLEFEQSEKPVKGGRNRSGPIVDLVKLAFPRSSKKTT